MDIAPWCRLCCGAAILHRAPRNDDCVNFLCAGLEDHALKRQKDHAKAEEILMKISNGDLSDGDHSDDEMEEENEENIASSF